jgi:nucleotide-binding universal stress UspA family protein
VRLTRARRHAHPDRLRVVVAVDGSPDSAHAVEAVATRSWPRHAQFRVVTVLDPRLETALAWPGLFAQQFVPLQAQETREAACRILEQASARLAQAGLAVETQLLGGDARHEIIQHADRWDADAVFLGARGLHHGGRLSLGTLASGVAARAHCTVEIVRPA